MVDGRVSAAVRTSVAHESFRVLRPGARDAFVVTVSGDDFSGQGRAIVSGGEEGLEQAALDVITAFQE